MSRDDPETRPPRLPKPESGGRGDEDRSTFRSAKGRGSGPDGREAPGGPGYFERVIFGRVGSAQLSAYCRQMASYLHAGVDFLKTLGGLQKSFARTALGPITERLLLAVRRGDSLSDAMAREPQAFDTFFLSLIRVAEARGGLPEALRRLAEHYEARQRLIRQARSALIYPVTVLLVASVVIWLLTVFILPKFVDLLSDMSRGHAANIPGPTRLLIALSGFMRTIGWWAVPLAAVGGFFLLARYYRTSVGKAMLDRIALHVPVLGPLARKIDTARFAGTMSALLDGGVDYGPALDLSADVLRMSPIREAVRAARPRVVSGTELSAALDRSGQFQPEVISVIETGEETGKLPESLQRLADSYEEQIEYTVKNLGSLIQPVLVIILGGFVMFVAVAFVMAYVSVLSGLMGG